MEKPRVLWRRLTIFRRKGHAGENMSVIPHFDKPSVEGGIYLCRKNSAELNKGVDCAFAKRGPRIGDFQAAASKIPCFSTFAIESDM